MKLWMLAGTIPAKHGTKTIPEPTGPEAGVDDAHEIKKDIKRRQLTQLQMPSMTSVSNLDAPVPMRPKGRMLRQG